MPDPLAILEQIFCSANHRGMLAPEAAHTSRLAAVQYDSPTTTTTTCSPQICQINTDDEHTTSVVRMQSISKDGIAAI